MIIFKKIYRRTCFNKKVCKDTNIVPDKNTKYACKSLLLIHSIYNVLEDRKDNAYYPPILVEQCGSRVLLSTILLTKSVFL